jgi:hypothetical protein
MNDQMIEIECGEFKTNNGKDIYVVVTKYGNILIINIYNQARKLLKRIGCNNTYYSKFVAPQMVAA